MGDEQAYSQAERDRMIAKIRAGLEAGKAVAVTAKELGITAAMFYRWLRQRARAGETAPAVPPTRAARAPHRELAEVPAGKNARPRWLGDATSAQGARRIAVPGRQEALAMRPVALVPDEPARGGELRLVSPGGYRVEGLDVAQAAALLRALT